MEAKHPSDQQLQEYAAGRGLADVDWIERHLGVCQRCVRQIEQFSNEDDSFLAELKGEETADSGQALDAAESVLDETAHMTSLGEQPGAQIGPYKLLLGASNRIKLWDLESSGEVGTLAGHTSDLAALALSPDGKRLISGSTVGELRDWDLSITDQQTTLLAGMKPASFSGIKTADMSHDGSRIASAGEDGTVSVWNVSARAKEQVIPAQSRKTGAFTHCVRFSPDGKLLAYSGKWNDGATVRVWDLARRQEAFTLADGSSVWSVAFSPDGNFLATASDGGRVNLWDLDQPYVPVTLVEHPNTVRRVLFSPNGKTLFCGAWATSAGTRGMAEFWDVATRELQQTMNIGGYGIWHAVFSNDGEILAAGHHSGNIDLYRVRTGEHLRKWDAHAAGVHGLVFSPDGKTLASGGWDNTVRLWDTEDWQARATFTGAYGNLEWSPEGNLLMATDDNGSIRLWEAATEKEVLSVDW